MILAQQRLVIHNVGDVNRRLFVTMGPAHGLQDAHQRFGRNGGLDACLGHDGQLEDGADCGPRAGQRPEAAFPNRREAARVVRPRGASASFGQCVADCVRVGQWRKDHHLVHFALLSKRANLQVIEVYNKCQETRKALGLFVLLPQVSQTTIRIRITTAITIQNNTIIIPKPSFLVASVQNV